MLRANSEVIFTASSAKYPASHHNAPHHRRCINGKITGCGNCVGYCNYSGHPGYLTKELRKNHNCIKKGCNYYIPKMNPPVTATPFAVLAVLL